MKVITKHIGHSSEIEQLKREVRALKTLKHPNIVKLIKIYDSFDKVYLVLEYCKGGDLVSSFKTKLYTEQEIKSIFFKLLNVIG